MEAVSILQGILDNQIVPHRVPRLHGIFRVGKFLAVTDGHAALCIKSDESPENAFTDRGVIDGLTKWLAIRSTTIDVSLAAIKDFISHSPKLPEKCVKCDNDGSVKCRCKNGCKKCDYEGMRSCDCGYTSLPVDPVVIGNKVYNRYLLEVFLDGLEAEKFRYIESEDEKEKLILGDTDWRLFVMPMRRDKDNKLPQFDFKEYPYAVPANIG